MKVLSFCVYGKNKIYYHGLLENIRLIKEHFPDFLIFIYVGSDYLQDFFKDIGAQVATNKCFLFSTTEDLNSLYNQFIRIKPLLGGFKDWDSKERK